MVATVKVVGDRNRQSIEQTIKAAGVTDFVMCGGYGVDSTTSITGIPMNMRETVINALVLAGFVVQDSPVWHFGKSAKAA